jgi:hypothetical protein
MEDMKRLAAEEAMGN